MRKTQDPVHRGGCVTAQPAETTEDGNLPAALKTLGDAIHRLTGPQSRFMDGALHWASSRYMQLQESLHGEQVNAGTGGGSKSRPPFWTDAHDLLQEIDEAVACWQPAYTGVPPTVGRLKWIEARKWRPQDCRQIEQITGAVAEWAAQIDALLDPPKRWTLPYPCPSCEETIVYRRDSGGDRVRQQALQISEQGCTCVACKAYWPPEKFTWLGRVLGSLPDNVGE